MSIKCCRELRLMSVKTSNTEYLIRIHDPDIDTTHVLTQKLYPNLNEPNMKGASPTSLVSVLSS